MTEIVIIPGKIDSKENADRLRGLRAGAVLWELLTAAKAQLDVVDWYSQGLAEAEAVLEAWQTGGQHGFFDLWEERKGTIGANRPPPATHEREARRMVLLMCLALERSGLGREAARKAAARALEPAGVFAKPPTHRVIEHWQDDQPLRLTPRDEMLLAMALGTAGIEDPQRIARQFIGLAHLVFNPAARVVRED